MTNEQSNDSIRLVPLMGIAAISALLASGVQFALSSGDASAHAGSGSTPVVAAVDGKRVPFGLKPITAAAAPRRPRCSWWSSVTSPRRLRRPPVASSARC